MNQQVMILFNFRPTLAQERRWVSSGKFSTVTGSSSASLLSFIPLVFKGSCPGFQELRLPGAQKSQKRNLSDTSSAVTRPLYLSKSTSKYSFRTSNAWTPM